MLAYYRSGVTRPLAFRKQQLKKLRQALNKYENAIAEALYRDLGKSPEEAYGTETGLVHAEISTALKNLRKWVDPKDADTNLVNLPSGSKLYRDPLGMVLIIAPWNYPMQLLLVPLVGAIAGGNVAVIKPSEVAPATSAVIHKMISETFSLHYIKVVQGDGAEVVPMLMKSYRFDYVFYTGSLSVGKIIYQLAAEKLVPVTLELGGKSPAVVEKDANVTVAARRIALGKYLNSGQTCIAPDYVLVHADIKEKFISKLKEAIVQFYTKEPSSSNDYGKIINKKRFDTLTGYLKNANIIWGGKYDMETLFIEPTVIEGNNDPSSPIFNEEIFGPVLPVFGFETFEEAKGLVERNPNPLAFYVFTSNIKTEQKWINEVSFGGGCVNNTAWHFSNHNLPFGGVGNSGIGAYHGKGSFDTFTRVKPVMKTPTWFDPSIKYPPFKGKLKLFKWFFR
ncbi:MAG TPA: aldehyde dehydrogenase [Flavitalea sp.]|nr:aldehyde dehydrogenase [Flavitalea sp.]